MHRLKWVAMTSSALLLFAGALLGQPGPAGPPKEERTIFVVKVHPEATLTIGEQVMKQTGAERTFQTMPLAPGSYSYQFVAKWKEDGQDKMSKKKATFEPGKTVKLDLTKAAEKKKTEEKKKTDPEKKTEPEKKLDEKKLDKKTEPEKKLDEKKIDKKTEPEKKLDEKKLDKKTEPEKKLDEKKIDKKTEPEKKVDKKSDSDKKTDKKVDTEKKTDKNVTPDKTEVALPLIAGAIKAVDVAKGNFTIAASDVVTHTFTVNESTKFVGVKGGSRGMGRPALADETMVPGSPVRVLVAPDGRSALEVQLPARKTPAKDGAK